MNKNTLSNKLTKENKNINKVVFATSGLFLLITNIFIAQPVKAFNIKPINLGTRQKVQFTPDGKVLDVDVGPTEAVQYELTPEQIEVPLGFLERIVISIVDKFDIGKQLKGIFESFTDLSNIFSINKSSSPEGFEFLELTPIISPLSIPGTYGNTTFNYKVDPILNGIEDIEKAKESIGFVKYEAFGTLGNETILSPINEIQIEQVPEPLTILGSVTALGFGTLFKKKKLSSKTQ